MDKKYIMPTYDNSFKRYFKDRMPFLFNDKEYDPIASILNPMGLNGWDPNSPVFQMVQEYDKITGGTGLQDVVNPKYDYGKDDQKHYGHRDSVDSVGEKGVDLTGGMDSNAINGMYGMYGLMALGDIEAQRKNKELLDPLSLINRMVATTGGDLGYFAEGGYAGNSVDYQTEGGEVMVLPDLSIIETAATKSHEKMPKNKVTDTLPEGTYIGSVRNTISKKDADKIIIARSITKYKEGEKPKEPKQYTLGDIFTKDKETVADLFKLVQKKFPVEEKIGDIATEQTNQLNKMNRKPYLDAIITLAEAQKNPKQKNEKVNYAKDGGYVTKENVPKALAGALAIAALAQAGASIVGNGINYYLANKSAKKANKTIEDAYAKSKGLQDLGLAATIGSVLAQNPNKEATDRSDQLSEIKSLPGELPYTVTRSVNDSGDVNLRNLSTEIFKNSSSFAEGLEGISKIYGKSVESKNNMAIEIAKINSDIAANKSSQLASLKGIIAAEKTAALNDSNEGRNQQLGLIGKGVAGYAGNMSDLNLGETNAKLAVQAGLDSATQQFVSGIAGSVGSGISGAIMGNAGGSNSLYKPTITSLPKLGTTSGNILENSKGTFGINSGSNSGLNSGLNTGISNGQSKYNLFDWNSISQESIGKFGSDEGVPLYPQNIFSRGTISETQKLPALGDKYIGSPKIDLRTSDREQVLWMASDDPLIQSMARTKTEDEFYKWAKDKYGNQINDLDINKLYSFAIGKFNKSNDWNRVFYTK